MGAGQAKPEGHEGDAGTEKKSADEPVVGSKAYALWDMKDVRNVRERARAYAVEENPSLAPVTRRQFWELFSDYSKLIGAQFLSLPITLFETFKDHPDSVTVNATEVLLMLGLFCHAKTTEQLEFCFNLFDFDGGGSIDRVSMHQISCRQTKLACVLTAPLCACAQEEMTTFMTLLTRAAYKVHLIPMPVDPDTLPAVTENMFHIADADGGGDVDAHEFISWAQSHVLGKKLLAAFRTKKRKAHALSKPPVVSARSKELRSKLKASAHSHVAGKRLMAQLSRSSGFNVSEMRDLREQFSKAANEDGVRAALPLLPTVTHASQCWSNVVTRRRLTRKRLLK